MRLAPDEHFTAFRSELERWLDENLPTRDELAQEQRRSSAHMPDWARQWQRRLYDSGWLVPGWPPELGGRNATDQEQMVYFEVVAERGVPRSLNPQGLSIVAASLIEFGNEDQRERFAIPTLKGDLAWCIGMSEPGAGSDLASLSTRAELQGDCFVVNGQKVWTSGAHDADYCMCYVRTDPQAPKHRGISVVIIDMQSDGITIRPLPELTDPHHADFNEVFFTDVEVPAENLVGELNKGWAVSQGSLRHERAMLWVSNVTKFERTVAALRRLAATPDGDGGMLGDDPRFAEQLAELAIDAQSMRCLGYRGFAKATRGEMPPEHMMLKLFSSEAERRACLLGTEVQGVGGLDLDGPGPYRREAPGTDVVPGIEGPETAKAAKAAEASEVSEAAGDGQGEVIDPAALNMFDSGAWAVQYLRSFAGTIAGGTSEIQRNILAERVLGLPR